MIRKAYLILAMTFTFTNFLNAQDYWMPNVQRNSNDSMRTIIYCNIQDQYAVDSLNVFAEVLDSNMPEGWYAIFRIDTIHRKLIKATSYVYEGKAKYLTNYHFFNDKLIATSTTKYLIKNQDSKKWAKWERSASYWNDTLVHSFTTENESFDYKTELNIGYEILKRFQFLYTSRKLYFTKSSNMGHFK